MENNIAEKFENENVKSSNVNVNVKNIMYISSILSLSLFSIAGYNIGDIGSISGSNILGIGSLFKSISYICYGFGVFSFSLLWYLGYNYKGSWVNVYYDR